MDTEERLAKIAKATSDINRLLVELDAEREAIMADILTADIPLAVERLAIITSQRQALMDIHKLHNTRRRDYLFTLANLPVH